MRIGLDARCLNTNHLRGMGKAAFELLREAADRPDISFVLLADEPRAPVHHPQSPRISSHVREVKGHRFRAWEQVGLPWQARSLGCDLLHCTGTWCPYWQPLPVVVTVHDTVPWDDEGRSLFLDRTLPAAYRRARAIITISESSRRDIVARWPDLSEKITVIPHGVHERYLASTFAPLDASLEAAGVRSPYLLYVGGEIPRKRLQWAIDVWKALERLDVQLVICGLAEPQADRWKESLPPALRNRLTCLGFVAEDAMPSLYAHAAAVLYPTLYEGFGFPALESQAVGVPVLMSDVGSLTELTGPGAIVLPSDDFQAWVAACQRILEGKGPRAAEARRWAARFTWQNALRRTLDVYQSVLAA